MLITHDLALASSRCDRMLVMDEGRIVEEGSPQEVIGHPRSAAARRLIEAAEASL